MPSLDYVKYNDSFLGICGLLSFWLANFWWKWHHSSELYLLVEDLSINRYLFSALDVFCFLTFSFLFSIKKICFSFLSAVTCPLVFKNLKVGLVNCLMECYIEVYVTRSDIHQAGFLKSSSNVDWNRWLYFKSHHVFYLVSKLKCNFKYLVS